MSGGREALRARRARLVERAAIERDDLAGLLEAWRRPLATADRAIGILASLKRNAPLIGAGVGAGVAALAFIRPRNISGWLRGGLAAWEEIRSRRRGAARLRAPAAEPGAEAGEK